MRAPHKTREAWLQDFAARARKVFSARGFTVPEGLRVGVGFTSKGARSKAIGECWSQLASADGTVEIFLHPALGDAERAADVLTHEMAHAAVGLEDGHGRKFGRCARAMGLEGKLTATKGGAEWKAWAAPILAQVGPYPHARLAGGASSEKPKQTTRMLKATCGAAECGYTVRLAKKWVEDVGAPHCPNHGEMTMDGAESDAGANVYTLPKAA